MEDNAIVRTLGNQRGLDRVAEPVQSAVHGALEKAPIVHKALHGTSWLGHPLHPALTDFPIGAWGAGFVLDLIELSGRNRKLRPGADAVHAFGLGTALLTAVAGLVDWAGTERRARRVGFVHGVMNIAVAGLYGASLYQRSRGRRRAGIALSSAGFVMLLASGWLGREMSYSLGVGMQEKREKERERRERQPYTAPAATASTSFPTGL
jgi:uncharacterized membrane protein